MTNLINQFLQVSSVNLKEYSTEQLGSKIIAFQDDATTNLKDAHIALVGINDYRGENLEHKEYIAENIRQQFFELFAWEKNIRIVDFGNIIQGNAISDTEQAMVSIQELCFQHHVPLIFLGGSQNLTKGQYAFFAKQKKICNLCNIDPLVDFDHENKKFNAFSFLKDIFLTEPNYLKTYFHLGLQSYFQSPDIVNKFFNLDFETYRIGKIREDFYYIEPCFRLADFLSIDINSLAHYFSPASRLSPNGFTGEEFCMLGQFAGMSHNIQSIGIYGFSPGMDNYDMSAKLIAQFLWYVLEGKRKIKYEGNLEDTDKFTEQLLFLDNVKTLFFRNKITGRWWMKIEDFHPLPCAYADFLSASKGEITEQVVFVFSSTIKYWLFCDEVIYLF